MDLAEYYELFEMGREETVAWLQDEVTGLRTGRVTPTLVEKTPVEHYGARTPLNGLAGISNADARTLVIQPWDPSAVDPIAKALTEAQLGANPNVDGELIRLVFPSLTEEAREQAVKALHQRAEEARVRLRQARDEALRGVKQDKAAGALTEDDFYEGKSELDKRIEAANKEVQDVVDKKEVDIRAV